MIDFEEPTIEEINGVSLAQQIECVRREITMRKVCYPRWVKGRQMTEKTANREFLRMSAVLQTLEELRIMTADMPMLEEMKND